MESLASHYDQMADALHDSEVQNKLRAWNVIAQIIFGNELAGFWKWSPLMISDDAAATMTNPSRLILS